VELAVKAPAEVNELWKVEAPVTPIPPEVTNKAAECDATPAKLEVDPNTAAPETPSPVPSLTSPDTPRPPAIIKAPEVEDVEFVIDVRLNAPMLTVELNTAAPLTVSPPVTPKPPDVMFTLDDNVATPDTDSVELAVNAPDDVNEVWKVEAPVTPIPPF
jgi:hypothetical protein